MKEFIPLIIPILGISAGIIIPIAVFIWQYYDEKGKRSAVIEIAQHLGYSSRVDELLHLFDERKKAPIDYRRGGVITTFVGIGIFLLGFVAIGSLVRGVGLLACAIGIGTLIAGYLYPNTSEVLTNAVEEFEGQ